MQPQSHPPLSPRTHQVAWFSNPLCPGLWVRPLPSHDLYALEPTLQGQCLFGETTGISGPETLCAQGPSLRCPGHRVPGSSGWALTASHPSPPEAQGARAGPGGGIRGNVAGTGSHGCSWPSVARASRPFTPIPLPCCLAATLEASWTKATPCPNTLQTSDDTAEAQARASGQ